jgi:hypothetical protein
MMTSVTTLPSAVDPKWLIATQAAPAASQRSGNPAAACNSFL